MFETELVRYLQSASSDWLTIVMLLITVLGSSPVQTLMITVVMLGVNLRKGFLIAHMVIWASLLTDFFKNLFESPRPYQVEGGVRRPDLEFAESRQTDTLFRTAYRQVIDLYGLDGATSYGFPSGHVSATTTTWGGASLLFPSRPVRVFAISLITLVAISRIYLGRHFLGDVIGGFLLGVIIVLIFGLVVRSSLAGRILESAKPLWKKGAGSFSLLAYLTVLPIALAFIPMIDAEDAGKLLGLNVAFLLLSRKGLPSDAARGWKRLARVLSGLLLVILIHLLFYEAERTIAGENVVWLRFIRGFAKYFALIWVTVVLGTKIGLFERGAK